VEGNTPGRHENKRVATKVTSRKSLFSEKSKSSGHREWSEEETSALVQYICLYWEDAYSDRWPIQSDTNFWDAVAGAVNKACNSTRTV
jgi:hypothetical protein